MFRDTPDLNEINAKVSKLFERVMALEKQIRCQHPKADRRFIPVWAQALDSGKWGAQVSSRISGGEEQCGCCNLTLRTFTEEEYKGVKAQQEIAEATAVLTSHGYTCTKKRGSK